MLIQVDIRVFLAMFAWSLLGIWSFVFEIVTPIVLSIIESYKEPPRATNYSDECIYR